VQALESNPSAVFLDARYDIAVAAQLCRSLRAIESLSAVHAVGVTTAGDADARLLLYEAGADDCWTFLEGSDSFQRRAMELVRPSLTTKPQPVLRCGGITLDRQRYTVTCWGRTAQLTAMQLRLLAHLMKQPGVVFSYRQLLEDVWRNPDGDERMVRAGIVRLRRVLGRGAAHIKTIRGGGYAFQQCDELSGSLDSRRGGS
jgi:DNA-binding response OmpR family regulator